MALVKRAALGRSPSVANVKGAPEPPAVKPPTAVVGAKPRRISGKRQTAGERVAAATLQLAGGVAQSAAAAEQLRRAMEQIATAAEEAAGAAHESLGAVGNLFEGFNDARRQATESQRASEGLQTLLAEAASQVEASIEAIQRNAARQLASVQIVAALQRGAGEINQTAATVTEISDQTNLLALNAAIEGARAGDEGRGFAVVADEVRTLAVEAEASAAAIQRATDAIAREVGLLAERLKAASDLAAREAETGRVMAEDLSSLRGEIVVISEGAQAVLVAAVEAEGAAREAQRGAEAVSSAAEQQAAAAAEAQRAVEQQVAALEESQRTAQALADLAEHLVGEAADVTRAQDIGVAAEQLSSAVQELSSAAGEILTALDQISRGAQSQAAAAAQSQAALGQIRRSAEISRSTAVAAVERVRTLQSGLGSGRERVRALSTGVATALAETRTTVESLASLEGEARRVERLVDTVVLTAAQIRMLAVSGAVEAARAGDKGRGFANVSVDIRTLARDAAGNADQAKDAVRAIQAQIGVVRRDLEQIAAVAEAEVLRNTALDQRLGTLEVEASTVAQAAIGIEAGAAQILSAADEVLRGAQQISVAADQAGAAAAQSATAARQQSQGAEGLAAAIEEIASLADALQAAEA